MSLPLGGSFGDVERHAFNGQRKWGDDHAITVSESGIDPGELPIAEGNRHGGSVGSSRRESTSTMTSNPSPALTLCDLCR